VTPRRWLRLANPALADAISQAIGDNWIVDHGQLRGLRPLAADRAFRGEFLKAKRTAKARFADCSSATAGVVVDPETMFDCQVKRIHEYKRQLLNALRVVVLYNRLRENPTIEVAPAHLLLRRQGRSRLQSGKVDHQAHQQPCRHDRR